MTASYAPGAGRAQQHDAPGTSHTTVILASSAGTFFECYDFFLYGALAGILGARFFAGVNDTTAYLLALMAFAAGFIVRPFGAVVFGRMGDLVGRKKTFLVAVLLMGLSTFAVGLLPDHASIGIAAPIALVLLRMMQGLAYGGEYGGAATYVAEHAPPGRRGFYTSFIQAMSTAGLALALVVILSTRTLVGEDAFLAWAWRIPFLFSFVLLLVSLWMRRSLAESPAFRRMQADRAGAARRPVREAFGQWGNLRLVLIALFGLVAGQSVIWYTGQFYIMFFLERLLRVDGATTNALVITGLVAAAPLFVLSGWLSDKIGRKPVFFAGVALSILLFFPMFRLMGQFANPASAQAERSAPVTVVADRADCSVQFDPIGKSAFTTSCDLVKDFLARRGVSYRNVAAPAGALAEVRIGDAVVPAFRGDGLDPAAFERRRQQLHAELGTALSAAGYASRADPASIDKVGVIALVIAFGALCALVYGPMAAMLVELFPTRIRYTAMSLPYHLGNGWIGGLLPTAAFALVAATGDIYAGLWYPIFFALVTLVIGMLFVPETRFADLDAN